MRAKTTLTALALTAAACAALAGPAGAATKTSISIQAQSSGVFGFVKSSTSSCHSGRKVTVYRKVAGPDKKAGSDTAQPNQDGSQYSVGLTRKGKYYAKVKATKTCQGKISKTVSFTPSESEEATAAHTLTLKRAGKGALAYALDKVSDGGNYERAALKPNSCVRLFPHRVRCYVQYFEDRDDTKPECTEKLMTYFKAHDGDRRDYAVYVSNISRHDC